MHACVERARTHEHEPPSNTAFDNLGETIVYRDDS